MPGLGGEALSKLGASVQNIPGGEIYQALSSGALDATEWIGPWSDEKLGLQEVCDYYYPAGFHEPGAALSVATNLEVFESLTPAQQKAIEIASSEAHQANYAQFIANNGPALERLKDGGTQVMEFSDDIWDAFGKASMEVLSAVRGRRAVQEDQRQRPGFDAGLLGLAVGVRQRLRDAAQPRPGRDVTATAHKVRPRPGQSRGAAFRRGPKLMDLLAAFVVNVAMGVYNLIYAISHPGLWLDWSNEESLMRFIYYGASSELFFVLFDIFIVVTIIGLVRPRVMWALRPRARGLRQRHRPRGGLGRASDGAAAGDGDLPAVDLPAGADHDRAAGVRLHPVGRLVLGRAEALQRDRRGALRHLHLRAGRSRPGGPALCPGELPRQAGHRHARLASLHGAGGDPDLALCLVLPVAEHADAQGVGVGHARLDAAQGVDPALERRDDRLLAVGLQRLLPVQDPDVRVRRAGSDPGGRVLLPQPSGVSARARPAPTSTSTRTRWATARRPTKARTRGGNTCFSDWMASKSVF